MQEGLVSVVVPIFNVEQYLDRCIESVINQTYRDLEIILVDDGSPDGCPQKCDEWAAKDSRIKVIHKENAGLGMARNTGIDHATGEYIYFVDSDDYIALNTIEMAYQCISQYHAEIVHFGWHTVDLNGKIEKCIIPQTEKMLYQGAEVQTYVLPNMIGSDPQTGKERIFTASVWGCMYSMAAIQRSQWRFVSERQYIFEDMYSHLLLYKDITSVAVLPEALYFYCENRMSLTHVYRKDRYEKIRFFYDESIKTCDALGYGEQLKERLAESFVQSTLSALKIIASENCNKKEKAVEINSIHNDRKLYEVISKMGIRHQPNLRKAWMIAIKCRLYGLARWMVMARTQRFHSSKKNTNANKEII